MPDITINVMMLGGRRCGKTSVLAFMQPCFERVFAGTNLTIEPVQEAFTRLKKRHIEINEYFKNKNHRITYFPSPDFSPTTGRNSYEFKIGIQDKTTDEIIVNFIDTPGEWLTNGNFKNLTEIMNTSHVIIVAIDSPYLMEESESYAEENNPGKYNEFRNHCETIGKWVKKYFADESNLSAKMILFVPLKCERYYHEGRMDELNKKTKKAYASTLDFFKSKEECYEVAITPILTFGGEKEGVEFRYFDWDEKGKILEDENSKLPKSIVYRIPREMEKPEPLHCEQPVVYLLAYILKVISQNIDVGFFNRTFRNFASAQDFLDELDTIKTRMKRDDNGYEIVQNPLEL